jgi:hypothetical protein
MAKRRDPNDTSGLQREQRQREVAGDSRGRRESLFACAAGAAAGPSHAD